ncbi:acyl-CoA desaturase [Vibrio genomosp. F10]|uniref:acyl-CoA desaturase n=1 Tax=Vibrio genomosp. F10 TaxID=723171 RepID=UPI00030017A8|nr:fatty acid desaturase [Vibrio genomosp. F10]OEF07542.1 acyl-CoA desaturase [Vibrio genomosp. F10 str. 9ZB36]
MSKKDKPPLIWLNIFIFTSSLFLAIIVAPWYGFTYGLGIEHLIWLVVCFSFCSLSITAGYHRLWSHKTYQAHWSLRLAFAIGGAFAMQNSILHWSSDHRIHHKHVDNNDKDPYSAKKGFWFSHIGWMIRDYHGDTYTDYSNCRDLQKDPIVVWQHKYYGILALVMNVVFPVCLGLIYGDVIGMFLIVGAVRLVLNHHTTFFINSLAHLWGSQPYTDKNTARDSAVLALLTFGEGYHNYHHIFENDYRNGIAWWHYDPTKWLIKGCSLVGLTHQLRKAPQLKIEKAKAAMSLRKAQKAIASWPDHHSINDKLQREFEALIANMNDYYSVKKQLIETKKDDMVKKYEYSVLKLRYEEIKKNLAEQTNTWNSMILNVNRNVRSF